MSGSTLTAEDRLDRLESVEAIRQLAARYALYVDSRDHDALLALFVDDVITGEHRGRAARRAAYEQSQGRSGRFRTTVHFVGNHVIELSPEDPDRATGVVYCRAEHEYGELWVVAMLQYWDTYERRGGQWMFEQRVLKAFYVADVLERPNGEERVKHRLVDTDMLSTAELPEAWPTWHAFWERIKD